MNLKHRILRSIRLLRHQPYTVRPYSTQYPSLQLLYHQPLWNRFRTGIGWTHVRLDIVSFLLYTSQHLQIPYRLDWARIHHLQLLQTNFSRLKLKELMWIRSWSQYIDCHHDHTLKLEWRRNPYSQWMYPHCHRLQCTSNQRDLVFQQAIHT